MDEGNTCLLLGLVSRTGPFRDDVLLGFGVGREGKGDARESGTLESEFQISNELDSTYVEGIVQAERGTADCATQERWLRGRCQGKKQ